MMTIVIPAAKLLHLMAHIVVQARSTAKSIYLIPYNLEKVKHGAFSCTMNKTALFGAFSSGKLTYEWMHSPRRI